MSGSRWRKSPGHQFDDELGSDDGNGQFFFIRIHTITYFFTQLRANVTIL